MIRYAVSILVFVYIFVVTAFAANTPAPKTPTQNLPTVTKSQSLSEKQWEYLIVSFGKTLFTDPTDNPAAKAVGLSKLISYSKAGVISAQEALGTQSSMDTLGKFGWELVNIVGAIGGDQQMVFRRIYDPERTKNEAALIKEEGERLMAEQRESASRQARLTKETTDLIDLDALEMAVAINETRLKEEVRLQRAIDSVKSYPAINFKVSSTAPSPYDSKIVANIEIDGTSTLLKDNKYRASEAKIMADTAAMDIYNAAGLNQDYSSYSKPKSPLEYLTYMLAEVKVNVSVKVTFQGTTKIVGTSTAGGKWGERAARR